MKCTANQREGLKIGKMENVKGYVDLTDEQKKLLTETYSAHLQCMGTEMQAKHAIEHIKEVKWSAKEKCLQVYFDYGGYYQYKDCTWY